MLVQSCRLQGITTTRNACNGVRKAALCRAVRRRQRPGCSLDPRSCEATAAGPAHAAAQDFVRALDGAPSSEAAATTTTSSSEVPDFNWDAAWYPVLPVSYADTSKPNAITLLNRQFVLWRDGSGAWRAHEDLCPHRLAPLSEGRIEADGTLSCSYHGWRFNGEGQCTRIPQSEDPKAHATACASSRSCLVSYPVKEQVGLLWLWPSAGPKAALEAAAAAPAVSRALEQHYQAGGTVNWYIRDLPYGYDILLENLCDPSHLPHSHHKLTPTINRHHAHDIPFTDLQPLLTQQQDPTAAAERPASSSSDNMGGSASGSSSSNSSSNGTSAPDKETVVDTLQMVQPLSAAADQTGALQQACAFGFPSAQEDDGVIVFNPPTTVVYRTTKNEELRLHNELMATPRSPGKARVFAAGFSRLLKSNRPTLRELLQNILHPTMLRLLLTRWMLASLPKWRLHMMNNKLFDQDGVFLAVQDKILHSQRWGSHWKKAYYMPTSCDSAVIAARRWIDTVGRGGPPYDAWKRQQLEALGSSNGNGAATAAAAGSGASLIQTGASTFSSRREMMDRYQQHTQHCPDCRQALAAMEKAAAALPFLGAALLAGFCILLASVGGVPGVFGGGAAGWAKVLGGGLLLGLAWCAAKYHAAVEAISTFYYVPFSHATNE